MGFLFHSIKRKKFHFLTACTDGAIQFQIISEVDVEECVLEVGRLTTRDGGEKGHRVSPASWCTTIINFLLAGRVYVPLPIERELELKCWHTSCIMWHWSDECSLPKSSTLSLVEHQYGWLERHTMWSVSLRCESNWAFTSPWGWPRIKTCM